MCWPSPMVTELSACGRRVPDPGRLACRPRPSYSLFKRVEATVGGWRADATLRGHGCEAPLRIDATLDGAATAPCLQVSGTARLDLRDVGIRVPGFLIRRFVDLSVSAQLTW